MSRTIQTVYIVHHSHTDIGYTDLQEKIIANQVEYLRQAVRLCSAPEHEGFRWNCETWFCVREFLKQAAEQEKQDFFRLMKEGKLGFSANYLNFTDLVDSEMLNDALDEMCAVLDEQGVAHRTAMFADINGISMGQRDALIHHGVEFLYTNIHCHHGMYPLYQNQTAYRWENAEGKQLLVWNGEHYNLGNALGIVPNRQANFMTQDFFGKVPQQVEAVDILHGNLQKYLAECEKSGYAYPFIIASVSGVFSDNAPPEPKVQKMVNDYNERYGKGGVRLQMVSLQELYDAVAPYLTDVAVYHGDLTDWWAHGIGSTPYAVKHYRDARHRYHECLRLEKDAKEKYAQLAQKARDRMLLYAEHTWGHSSTITHPYESMVLHLDMRKNGYASDAHEAASCMMQNIRREKGELCTYYSSNGVVRVYPTACVKGLQPVEFYLENPHLKAARVVRDDGVEMNCQIHTGSRGQHITFLDCFEDGKPREYTFTEQPYQPEMPSHRHAYIGSERLKDIISDYDTASCFLPYQYENQWFRLSYRPGEGVTEFIHKASGKNMLLEGEIPFFTPVYECTPIRWKSDFEFSGKQAEERRLLGRNIRGKHAQLSVAQLKEIVCRERGPVFTLLEMKFEMEGSMHTSVFLRLFEQAPRIDFYLELGKTLSQDIESVFLPMQLNLDDAQQVYLKKGTEAFRPGIDQLPGTCMEYYGTDDGLAFVTPKGSMLIACHDVPLVYMGEMRHHAVRLCDGKPENNQRPMYSWVMNNIWETNFKMDLSGFAQYRYSLYWSEETNGEQAMKELTERTFDPAALLVKEL